MDYIIAVFVNRNEAMQFASVLKRIGVRSKTVSTPRELSVSCGISIIFDRKHLNQAKLLLQKLGNVRDVRLYGFDGSFQSRYVLIK